MSNMDIPKDPSTPIVKIMEVAPQSETTPFRNLLSMPPEIVHRLFNCMGTKTVQLTRLTCKTLANIGAEYLIREIPLVYKRDRFERLSAIAAEPTLSKGVRSLYYQGDQLPEFQTFTEWFNSNHIKWIIKVMHEHTTERWSRLTYGA